jgi:hypothetical protein
MQNDPVLKAVSGNPRADHRSRFRFQSASRWTKPLALLALMLIPAVAIAHQPSRQECAEGGDFIKNAALARDHGMPEASFISRIQDDIEVIKAFPPPLRWFVQDDEAAEFLIAAATEVFRKPKEASKHQADFVKACLRKVVTKPGTRL